MLDMPEGQEYLPPEHYLERIALAQEQLVTVTKDIVKYLKPSENPTGLKSRQELVITAGTAVQLSNIEVPPDYKAKIKSLSTNTGIIYLAPNKPNAENHTMAYQLTSNTEVKLGVDNLNRIWMDADNSGEGISWVVEQRAKEVKIGI